MNGPHDLGGADGFGAVPYERDDAPFHKPWEGRVFALAGAGMTRGLYGTPKFRHAMERLDPVVYLSSSYFERWMMGIATLLTEAGATERADLEGIPLSRPVRASRIEDPGLDVRTGRYREGDAVRVRNDHPLGHTRCPRYVRGRTGTVVRCDGSGNFDDVEAHSDRKRLEPLYCVRFEGTELWGSGAEPGVTVAVDLFESYLEDA